MTSVVAPPATRTETRSRAHEIWRIVRLHCINPSVFFGIPLIILAGAWAIVMVIGLIARGAGAAPGDLEDMRYSWAVISPQWYLVVVGVQAVGLTFSFALGFGATRRDFWLGTAAMFGLVSVLFAAIIATLVQLEIATNGWGLGVHMFDALWYGQGWLTDFYTAFALQALVLFIGAGVTTIYMRWRIPGMLIVTAGFAVLLLGGIAWATLTSSWAAVFSWFASLGLIGVFSLVLAIAAICAVGGYIVIRRATPR
ncbi:MULTISPECIES: hypothetical protein [unclassified Leifsonia]|uniref:hypothetical protein n=1 Tax=unclassified Leifsonia TaxID=2663824 RepID=UPI0006FA57B5|nr:MULTISPECIES: hypothetical protein [unclassified Leifsonia]KQX04982.1 hypothetical protein ASC59_12110 [Leifsonia sp. Root1293]KRA08614.1 hypothetical protein ASD61_12110 [Leifsonia sp. Root60]